MEVKILDCQILKSLWEQEYQRTQIRQQNRLRVHMHVEDHSFSRSCNNNYII